MLSELQIDGKVYVPATEAGKYFEYTKDYLLLLIKEGKIDGKKVGHRWYVSIKSAEQFFDAAKKERALRRKKISESRKEELKQYTHDRIDSVDTQHRVALIETAVIVIIGLALGVTGYMGTTMQKVHVAAVSNAAEYGFFERLAISVYEFISPQKVVIVRSEQSSPVMPERATDVGTPQSLIVAPADQFSASSIESIEASFSDEVEVARDPNNPNTGIVTPIFKEREGDEYRFLMVPVDEKETP